MAATRSLITAVNRNHPIHVVGPSDFTADPAGEIPAEAVLSDPKFTLYCFDPENDAALFVESDDPAAVERAPFYYQAQAQHAAGLASMPLEEFHRVAETIPWPEKGLIFVHSVGRCGSTLVSKALEAVPAVHSYSEPDDLTQMVNLRMAGSVSEEWLRRALVSSVKWRSARAPDFVAIKPRAEVMALADLLGSCFPEAKHFFLYRNAVTWMASNFRGFPAERDIYDQKLNQEVQDRWALTLPLVRELAREGAPMNPVQVRTLSWVNGMENYLRLADMNLHLAAARFEDLTTNPIPILTQFFNFCGIDSVDWNAIQEVLAKDSQAGTMYDREERKKLTRELTPELIEDIKTLIASRPLLGSPDVIAPGTILPRGE